MSDYFSNVTAKITSLFEPKKVPKKRETRQIPQARLSYINGIFHSVQDCDEIIEQIESIFKLKVNAYYLPSTGSWMQDISKAGMILFTKPGNTDLVRGLTAHLRRLLNETAPHGRVLHIAHSAGAIITYLAAKHHLSYEEKKRIDVVTLGGGRSITKKYFPGRLVNYYSQNDPLTIVDSRAGSMLRRGKKLMQSMLYSSSKKKKEEEREREQETAMNTTVDRGHNNTKITPTGEKNSSTQGNGKGNQRKVSDSEDEELSELVAGLQEVREQKHNTSFVFLRGLAKHPVIDHRANGPTYLIALKREARTFRRQLRETLYLEARNRSTVRLVRKQFSKMTGQSHFWSRLITGNVTLFPTQAQNNVSTSNQSSSSSSPWRFLSLNWTTQRNESISSSGSHYGMNSTSGTTISVRSLRKLCARWTGQSHFWTRKHNASSTAQVEAREEVEAVLVTDEALQPTAQDDSTHPVQPSDLVESTSDFPGPATEESSSTDRNETGVEIEEELISEESLMALQQELESSPKEDPEPVSIPESATESEQPTSLENGALYEESTSTNRQSSEKSVDFSDISGYFIP